MENRCWAPGDVPDRQDISVTAVAYCGESCQRTDWLGHRRYCGHRRGQRRGPVKKCRREIGMRKTETDHDDRLFELLATVETLMYEIKETRQNKQKRIFEYLDGHRYSDQDVKDAEIKKIEDEFDHKIKKLEIESDRYRSLAFETELEIAEGDAIARDFQNGRRFGNPREHGQSDGHFIFWKSFARIRRWICHGGSVSP